MEDKRKNYVKAIAVLSPSQFIYFLVILVSSFQELSCVHTQVNWFHPRACLKNYKSDDRISFLGDLLKFRASLYILGNAEWLCKRKRHCGFFLFLCFYYVLPRDHLLLLQFQRKPCSSSWGNKWTKQNM